ncbi:glycosyltransferase [Ornithinimicrobium cryptoxanthini]|uniref:glycosyltransferase n=1 Tax=Ornithinimicrobium cryptoxanthini TaxID=2934161 RepID=UPI00211958E5|nr:glycosyltransferase [Ornithinimicrobium cryptoxanthini]
MDAATAPRIVAVVPCHDEEAAVGKVVTDLLEHVPVIQVYVYDNASTDRTAQVAREAGAHVRTEPVPGKGNVVRRAFADLDSDVYLLVGPDSASRPRHFGRRTLPQVATTPRSRRPRRPSTDPSAAT